MARRSTPERIYQARRAAIAGRLVDTGMAPDLVERWLSAWETAGEDRVARDYWERGLSWIIEWKRCRRNQS